MKYKKKNADMSYMTKFLATALLFAVTSGVVAVITSDKTFDAVGAISEVSESPYVIVIDPGHGGEDPGASSDTGILEKDINLDVSLLCASLLKAAGNDVRLTRTNDRMLYDMYDDLDDYDGKKKIFDLKNRIRFADERGADIFVSIHMNKFFQPQYGGLQVYYSSNEQLSEFYASHLQEAVKMYLQSKNERQIKKATSSIYLLNNIQRSAVLIECGFLSNSEDLRNMTEPMYQLDLSTVFFASLTDSLNHIKESAN